MTGEAIAMNECCTDGPDLLIWEIHNNFMLNFVMYCIKKNLQEGHCEDLEFYIRNGRNEAALQRYIQNPEAHS